jgi:hypothetical protein
MRVAIDIIAGTLPEDLCSACAAPAVRTEEEVIILEVVVGAVRMVRGDKDGTARIATAVDLPDRVVVIP